MRATALEERIALMALMLRWVASLLMVAVAACAGPTGPLFPDAVSKISPPAGDMARIYFYREYEPYESLTQAYLYLNGQPVAVSVPGGVSYRDVAPATYTLSAWTQGDFPNASKTVVARAGDTFYAKIESLRAWQSGGGDPSYERDTFIVTLVDPAQAHRDLARMHYVPPERTVARARLGAASHS
jgi:hypothetical protein